MPSDLFIKSRIVSALVVLGLFLCVSYLAVSQLGGINHSGDLTSLQGLRALIGSNLNIVAILGVFACYSLICFGMVARKTKQLVQYEKEMSFRIRENQKLSESEVFPNESFAASQVTDNEISKSISVKETVQPSDAKQIKKIGDLKQQLEETNSQLVAAQSVKSQFLANMSHELRTPMNGILGMTELLLGSGLNDKQGRFADSVRRSAESLLAIINDLLDYSRMESGNLLLEKAAFNIRELVEDVCDLHAELAQRKELELICHIDKDMHESVSGDSNRIRQLLTNLIGNAVKFTKDGEVVVRIKQNGDDIDKAEFQIDVVDTGVGITPEGQARLFESFTQADDSYAREYGGSGLGLFITHKLLVMMGGSIQLKSRMNEGSHFTVKINLDKSESNEENISLQSNLEGIRVLVVDDNETNRTILYHQLKSWGINPEAVSSGKKALVTLREAMEQENPFDIAILDLHMPGMDGLELTREIQADPSIRHTKRMMLTSAVLELDSEHLEKIGISQYISKPARQSQLHSALTDLAPERNLKNVSGLAKYEESYIPLDAQVLLAEDNLINQEVAENMLKNFGCEIEVVSTGMAALEACELRKFNIILMDCQMPVMDGLEATRRIREGSSVNQTTPVIALTANVLSGDREKCLKSGMNGYIGKPVKQDELYTEIRKRIVESAENKLSDSTSAIGATDEPLVDISPVQIHEKDNSKREYKMNSSSDKLNDEEYPNTTIAINSKVTEQVAPGSSGTTGGNDVINHTALDTIRKLQRPGKPDLVAKVVNVYLDKSPELVSNIVTGFREGDSTKVKEAAHSMKSSSAYVGADNLSEDFRKIELAASNDDLASVQNTIETLEMDFEKTVSCLGQLVEKAA